MNAATAPDKTGEEKPIVKSLARFSGPTGHLNQLGVKVPGEFGIHIQRTTGRAKAWRAFWTESNTPLKNSSGEEVKSEFFISLKTEIESYFEKRVTDWQDVTE